MVEHDRGVQGPAQGAVDEMATANLDRRVQAGQGGAGLDRTRYRHVVPIGATEAHRLAGIQVDRDDEKLLSQFAEIVAAPVPAEYAGEETLDADVVEQPGRHQSTQAAEQFAQLGAARIAEDIAPPVPGHAREAGGPTRVFQERRSQEDFRPESHFMAVAGDEDPVHLGRAQAVGQPGREEGSGADADVDIEAGRVEALNRFVECAQCAQFVHPADRSTAGDRQADAAGTFLRLSSGLQDEHAIGLGL